jgi:hypothetical protein
MSEIATRGHHATYDEYEAAEHATGWTGWVGFGGFMMILTGMLHIINGLVGLYRSSFYVVTNHSSQVLVFSNVRTWAWVSLIAGIIVALAGFSLFSGTTWSRVVAVLLSMAVVAVNLVSMALYPIWSIIAIAMAVMVMYAVIVHGGELRE